MTGKGTSSQGSAREVAAAFLRLGTTAFGGPAAHLAMMEEEFVRRRGWLDPEEFLDMIGAASLVPGPNSTEVAIHLGFKRAGIPGMAAAGVCFIAPAALIVSAIAWAYVKYGSLPNFQSALYGIKPVVVAVVAQAIWLLVGKAVDSAP
ncbi:chromate transporter, partial [bacterium]